MIWEIKNKEGEGEFQGAFLNLLFEHGIRGDTLKIIFTKDADMFKEIFENCVAYDDKVEELKNIH